MEVTFFFRNIEAGYSIHKVFKAFTKEIAKKNKVIEYDVPERRSGMISVIKNILFVFSKRNKRGINHITGDVHYCILGLFGQKSILTIHDLSAFEHPSNSLKKKVIKFLWFTLPLLIADRVVCISKHTQEKVMQLTKRNDIEVIYNSVDPLFEFKQKLFQKRFPVILQVGTAWNKNIENVVIAISGLNCHLVIIGNINKQVTQLLKENKQSFDLKAGLSDEALVKEYEQADIIAFCSFYEGFGMPIIEANAVGRAIITSNFAPMTEIGSAAACYIDPYSIDSIRLGMKALIENDDYREGLVEQGNKNIKRFNVHTMVDAYIKIYNSILAG